MAMKPSHYSLLQACVTNRRLAGARFIEQDGNSFKLTAASTREFKAMRANSRVERPAWDKRY